MDERSVNDRSGAEIVAYVARLKAALKDDGGLEGGMEDIKRMGASPADCIRAIRASKNVSLAEAKTEFSNSPAWSRAVEAGDVLHSQLLSLDFDAE